MLVSFVQVQAALDQLLLSERGNTTCIIVAHRLSTIANVDRVVRACGLLALIPVLVTCVTHVRKRLPSFRFPLFASSLQAACL